jgi:hypothetical protein
MRGDNMNFLPFLLLALMGCQENLREKQADIILPKKEEILVNPLAELVALAERSKARWLETKKRIADTYSYAVHFTSGLAPSNQTVIQVTNGKVTSRVFHRDGLGSLKEENWREEGLAIGTHRGAAAAPMTIDQLYAGCLDEVLKRDPYSATYSVTTFADGTLASCYSWPCGAVDDAASGITLKKLNYKGFDSGVDVMIKEFAGCKRGGGLALGAGKELPMAGFRPNNLDASNPTFRWLIKVICIPQLS